MLLGGCEHLCSVWIKASWRKAFLAGIEQSLSEKGLKLDSVTLNALEPILVPLICLADANQKLDFDPYFS